MRREATRFAAAATNQNEVSRLDRQGLSEERASLVGATPLPNSATTDSKQKFSTLTFRPFPAPLSQDGGIGTGTGTRSHGQLGRITAYTQLR